MSSLPPDSLPEMPSEPSSDFVSMEDFIFGTLATDELRLKELVTAANGLQVADWHLLPPDTTDQRQVQIQIRAGAKANVCAVDCYYTTDGSIPTVGGATTRITPANSAGSVWDTLAWSYLSAFEVKLIIPHDTAILRWMIAGETYDSRTVWAERGGRPQVYSTLIAPPPTPVWARHAVIYHIFMDRFAPTPGSSFAKPDALSGFYGGTFAGITSKLDYLHSLGVNALWLSPIFPSPSHHGYDYTDLTTVNSRFGTESDFRALVEAAHSRGMKIILDYVPNHLSNEHPLFQSAITDKAAPERDYFTFRSYPDEYESFFDVKTLPQINNENPNARRYVIDSALFWMREYGVDGFRLDYAYGPSHDFWTDYYHAVKTQNPDSFHFGEIVETPTLLHSYAGRMDGALDFLMLQQIRKLFAYGTLTPAEFEGFLSSHQAFFRDVDFLLPTFLDNHDMNRFLWVVRGEKRKVMQAAALQFTLPMPVIIYYGTEAGLSQERDIRQGTLGILEESRQPMRWERQDTDLKNFYARLIAFRKRCEGKFTGREAYLTDAKRYGYQFRAGSTARKHTCIFNLSDGDRVFPLPRGNWRDALNPTAPAINTETTLGAWGVLILEEANG